MDSLAGIKGDQERSGSCQRVARRLGSDQAVVKGLKYR